MKIKVSFALCLLFVSSVWLTRPPLNIDLNQPAEEVEEPVHQDPEQHQPQQVQQDTDACTKYHEPGCGHWGKLTPYQRTRNTQKKYYWNMPDEKKLARSRRGKEILTKEQKEQYRLTALMKEKKNPTKKQNREQGKGYWKDLRERKRKGDQIRGYEKVSDYWQQTTRTRKRKREDDNNDHHNPSPQ